MSRVRTAVSIVAAVLIPVMAAAEPTRCVDALREALADDESVTLGFADGATASGRIASMNDEHVALQGDVATDGTQQYRALADLEGVTLRERGHASPFLMIVCGAMGFAIGASMHDYDDSDDDDDSGMTTYLVAIGKGLLGAGVGVAAGAGIGHFIKVPVRYTCATE